MNNGSTWNLIDDEIDDTFYIWDSSGISSNQYTLIQIDAECTTGLTSFEITDEKFAIANVAHSLSIPDFVYPTVDEPVAGNVIVEWEEAVDSWYLPVTYELYYLNDFSEWELINDNIGNATFVWDTNPYEDGEMTLLVVAKNFEDVRVNATSVVFIIDNISR